MSLNEFEIIKNYFQPIEGSRSDVKMGIGDDAAVVLPPPGQRLVMAIDTLVAGIHFPQQTTPYDIGYKALAVNLSDLAAMGAEPSWVLLALTLPEADEAWLKKFCAGLNHLLHEYRLQLIGGDTTRGPLTITIQTCGFLPLDKGLFRNGAKPGDLIFVTGDLGDAGLALSFLQNQVSIPVSDQETILQRFNRPTPRVPEGLWLRDIASAAIDISDGLAADLGHVLQASGVGATLKLQDLPLSSVMKKTVNEQHAWELALTAGDDYELCFTIPATQRTYVERIFAEKFTTRCQCIGVIEEKLGLRLINPTGDFFQLSNKGYTHFG
ncbi:MAG: thiamine-phosphate kinase [Gammaproteobacteria bacterium]